MKYYLMCFSGGIDQRPLFKCCPPHSSLHSLFDWVKTLKPTTIIFKCSGLPVWKHHPISYLEMQVKQKVMELSVSHNRDLLDIL